MITAEIESFLNQHRLGFVGTVSTDGRPNISPKGTIIVWNSETLAFADIRSPDTVKNLQHNPNVEIDVIDPILRKGYLFQGKAEPVEDDRLYQKILNHYKKMGIQSPIKAIILVKVSHVSRVTSPLYDLGVTESEIKSRWTRHHADL